MALIALAAAAFAAPAHAETAKIAVASNFIQAAKEIGEAFENETGHQTVFSFGATGQLYAQIAHGAQFDIFLAADQARPQKAADEGLALPDSLFTYAKGRLVLYSADPALVSGEETLRAARFHKIAIANPVTAPYGAAAIEVMRALGVYDVLQGKLVQGANIAQAYQFVATGNAETGFVALSQVIGREAGSRWLAPPTLHAPLAQDAVLLKPGEDNGAARAFLDFLKSPAARAIIRRHGYDLDAPAGE